MATVVYFSGSVLFSFFEVLAELLTFLGVGGRRLRPRRLLGEAGIFQ